MHKLPWIVTPLVVLLLATGCSGDDDADPTSTPGAPASPTAAATAPAPAPTVPSDLLAGVSDEPVAFQAEDGVVIRGHLYAQPGPARKAVIFAHMFPADQISWKQTAQELTAAGVATLTFDFRGYGESDGDKEIDKIYLDLESAVLFLESRDFSEIYLVGASMGGTASLKVAATEAIAGVVAVSAPVEFRGLSAEDEVAQVTAPKLFIASSGDGAAADALHYFVGAAPDPKESQVFDGSAHGTDLLQSEHADALKQLIIDFIAG